MDIDTRTTGHDQKSVKSAKLNWTKAEKEEKAKKEEKAELKLRTKPYTLKLMFDSSLKWNERNVKFRFFSKAL